MGRKRIALLLAQGDETYQAEFVSGVLKKAFSYGYDVCIFSMYIKYQNSKAREVGESNIYNLIDYDAYDGFIVLADTIQTPGVAKKIEEQIHERFYGPVVCVDTDSEYFYHFWTDGYEAVYATISHLIKEHGYKDIAYLTGRKNHRHSKRRLEAYKDAMNDNGLEVKENRVFYGDFWYYSGTGCAEQLLRNPDDLPDAVVCANDCMAIGMAEELTQKGIKIPEDIAIAGFGTSEEGHTSPKSLTSTYIPADYYGEYSVDSVIRLMKENTPETPSPDVRLFIGESCGCESTERVKEEKRERWMTKNSEDGYESIHNYLMEDMLVATSLEEFFRTVYESIYYLKGVNKLEIFLDECWLDPEKTAEIDFRSEGYPDKMIEILVYDADKKERNYVGTRKMVETRRIQQRYRGENPKSCFYLPLFFEDKTFGFAMLSFGESIRSYDGICRLWFNSVSRGLESYRRHMLIDYYERMNSKKYMSDYNAAMVEAEGVRRFEITLSQAEMDEMEEVRKILDGNLLKYHFQPIVSAVDGEIYSYEALMRADTDKKISPLQILKYADIMGRLSDVERATFLNVLNIVEDKDSQFEGRKVFINSIPGKKLKEIEYEIINKKLEEFREMVVIEMTEQTELKDEELERMKDQYRKLGIEMAIDDYGTGYSNIRNLMRYMPDYVKIDRSLLSDIQNSSQKQHFVREVIDFCHANNIKALAEGIETAEELRTVIILGTDLIQGYYTARPSEEIIDSINSNIKMEINRFHQEKEDGTSNQIYVAGRNNRISLNTLSKENKNTIVIGEGEATFRDITIAGTANTFSNLHIEILEGYDGRVTLENVCLKNIKSRPCIDMAENSKLTLRLEGDNSFFGGGIKVPENSHIIFEGDGNLNFSLFGSESYAIGNSINKNHGLIEFYQDGEISIDSRGQTTIGIGSGLGGETRIHKGRYVIRMNGDEGVGVGSFVGDNPIIIHDCDLFMENTFYEGVCIGNVKNNTDINIWRSLIRVTCAGKKLSALGTLEGSKAAISIHDLAVHINARADYSTAFGSLTGETVFDMETAGLKYKGMGRESYVYGGNNDNVKLSLNDTDIAIELITELGCVSNAKKENIKDIYGMSTVTLNGVLLEDGYETY